MWANARPAGRKARRSALSGAVAYFYADTPAYFTCFYSQAQEFWRWRWIVRKDIISGI